MGNGLKIGCSGYPVDFPAREWLTTLKSLLCKSSHLGLTANHGRFCSGSYAFHLQFVN